MIVLGIFCCCCSSSLPLSLRVQCCTHSCAIDRLLALVRFAARSLAGWLSVCLFISAYQEGIVYLKTRPLIHSPAYGCFVPSNHASHSPLARSHIVVSTYLLLAHHLFVYCITYSCCNFRIGIVAHIRSLPALPPQVQVLLLACYCRLVWGSYMAHIYQLGPASASLYIAAIIPAGFISPALALLPPIRVSTRPPGQRTAYP